MGSNREAERLFPNDCEDPKARFDQLGDVLPAYVRTLPTREALDRVRAVHGDAADPVMGRWLELWRGSVGDVDAFAKEIGQYPLGPETEADAAPDAARMGPAFVRAASLHVLEDAYAHVEAVASGLNFAFLTCWAKRQRHLQKVPGVRRIAVVDNFRHQNTFRQNLCANPYWTLPAFRARAGRGMAIARDGRHLKAILMEMAAAGHAKAFLKAATGKGGTWIVGLAGVEGSALGAILTRTMGRGWQDFDSGKAGHSMLVQEFTPFTHEHRFFVVGHRVVASTASDRSLSILDRHPHRIVHPGVARLERPAEAEGYYDRGSTAFDGDRGLAARMAVAARGLARDLGREDIGLQCYVIDIGLTPDGRVLPVEINTLLGAGVYAADHARVLRGLHRWRTRTNGPIQDLSPYRIPQRPMATCLVEVERVAMAAVRVELSRVYETDRDGRPLTNYRGAEVGGDGHDAAAAKVRSLADQGAVHFGLGSKRKPSLSDRSAPDPRTTPALRRRWAGILAKAAAAEFERMALATLGGNGYVLRENEPKRLAMLGWRIPVRRVLHLAEPTPTPACVADWRWWAARRRMTSHVRRAPDHRVVHAFVAASDVDWRKTLARDTGCLVLRPGAGIAVTAIERPDEVMDTSARGTVLTFDPAAKRRDALPDRETIAQAYVDHCIDEGDVDSWDSFLTSTDQGAARLLSKASRDLDAWADAYGRMRDLYAVWARDDSERFVSGLFDKLGRMDVDPMGRVFLRSRSDSSGERTFRDGGYMHGGDHDMVVAYEDIDMEATCRNAFVFGTSGLVALKAGRTPLVVHEPKGDRVTDKFRIFVRNLEEEAA